MTNQEGRQTVTIIVPCYNEEQVLPLFLAAMAPVRQALEAECFLLFVDDGSKDHTLSLLRETAEKMTMWSIFLFPVTLEKKRLC